MAKRREELGAGSGGTEGGSPVPGDKSGKRMPAAERRRQLQAVAVEVFAERGYRAASIAEVAERAGVTKPVIYRHFSSKKDLYLEIIDDAAERVLSRIWGGVEVAADPFDATRRGFIAYFAFLARYAEAFHLVQAEAFEEVEIREKLESLRNRVIGQIAKFFVRAGMGLTAADREIVATCIVGIAELAGRHLVLNKSEDPEHVAEVAASLLVGGFDDLMRRFGSQADSRAG